MRIDIVTDVIYYGSHNVPVSRELETVVLNIGHSRIETFLESSLDLSLKI